MAQKKAIKAIISILLMLILIQPITAGDIDWSRPVSVNFYVVDKNPELTINIINPEAKTYNTKNIPLEISTNVKASCYYQIDSEKPVNLGLKDYFEETISVQEGSHTLKVTCSALNQTKTESVTFTSDTDDNKPIFNEEDKKREKELRTPIYGEWKCIKNQLQRTKTLNNHTSLEYRGICGLTITPEQPEQTILGQIIFYLLIAILIVAIAIILVLISKLALRR